MVYRTKFIVASILLVSACSDNRVDEGRKSKEQNSNFYRFPISLKIDGRFVGPMSFFAQPSEVLFVGDHVLVHDEKTSHAIHVLDSDYNLLHSRIARGKGPLEFEGSVQMIDKVDARRPYIEYYQYDRFITRLHFTDLGDGSFDSTSRIELPRELYNLQAVESLGDYGYAGLGGMSEGKICVLDSDLVYYFYPYTPNFQDKGHPEFEYLYNGDMAMLNDSMFVCVHNQINCLEVYSISDGLIHSTVFGDLHNPFQNEDIFYYSSVDSDGDTYMHVIWVLI